MLLANPISKTSNCARPIFFAFSNEQPSSRLNKRDEALAAWVLAARLLASTTQFCCRRSDLGIAPIAPAIGSSIRFDSSVHRRPRASGRGPHPRTTSCLNSISPHSRPPPQASPSHCLQTPLSGTAYQTGFPRTRLLSTQLLASQWSSPAPASTTTHRTTRCVIQYCSHLLHLELRDPSCALTALRAPACYASFMRIRLLTTRVNHV